MFAVNFYVSCFGSRGNSIGKKLLLSSDWEKAIYQPLFTLANTLKYRSEKGTQENEVSF